MVDSSNGAPEPRDDGVVELSLPEAVMLMLFDPRSGVIAGEGQKLMTLLGAATLTDLALRDHIELDDKHRKARSRGNAPSNPLLAESWSRVSDRFTSIRTLVFEIGSRARGWTLNSLIARGHIHKESRRMLGFIPTTKFTGGDTTTRETLFESVRAALLNNEDPDARTAILITLLSASRSFPAMNSDIPWSGNLHTRAKQFERGTWGAKADPGAVDPTVVVDIARIAFPRVLGGLQ